MRRAPGERSRDQVSPRGILGSDLGTEIGDPREPSTRETDDTTILLRQQDAQGLGLEMSAPDPEDQDNVRVSTRPVGTQVRPLEEQQREAERRRRNDKKRERRRRARGTSRAHGALEASPSYPNATTPASKATSTETSVGRGRWHTKRQRRRKEKARSERTELAQGGPGTRIQILAGTSIDGASPTGTCPEIGESKTRGSELGTEEDEKPAERRRESSSRSPSNTRSGPDAARRIASHADAHDHDGGFDERRSPSDMGIQDCERRRRALEDLAANLQAIRRFNDQKRLEAYRAGRLKQPNDQMSRDLDDLLGISEFEDELRDDRDRAGQESAERRDPMVSQHQQSSPESASSGAEDSPAATSSEADVTPHRSPQDSIGMTNVQGAPSDGPWTTTAPEQRRVVPHFDISSSLQPAVEQEHASDALKAPTPPDAPPSRSSWDVDA